MELGEHVLELWNHTQSAQTIVKQEWKHTVGGKLSDKITVINKIKAEPHHKTEISEGRIVMRFDIVRIWYWLYIIYTHPL